MIPDFLKAYMPPADTSPPVLRKWSFSSWSLFKDVPYILYAQEVLGRRRDSGAAADRGTAMHAALETYVLTNRIEGSPDPVGKAFVDRLLDDGWEVAPEKRFTLDRDWRETDEGTKTMTAILDVCAVKGGQFFIGDFKTGRKYEIKHTQQAQLYAAVLNQVYNADECTAEFVYLDGHSPLVIDFNKRLMRQAVDYWKAEAEKMLGYQQKHFAPPDTLDGIPKWYHPFLQDPNNYDSDHFPPPWYVKYT